MSEISKILDQNRSIYDLVLQDISQGASDKGAQGMTAEQVVRAAIVKQIVEKVIDQTVRQVINKEKVAATDKIFSIFEEHTDMIIKDNRDTYYAIRYV